MQATFTTQLKLAFLLARKTASDIFTGTGISISCEGKKYLGAPLGTDAFVHSFIHQQISTWEKELKLNLQSLNPMLLMLPLHMVSQANGPT